MDEKKIKQNLASAIADYCEWSVKSGNCCSCCEVCPMHNSFEMIVQTTNRHVNLTLKCYKAS